MFAILISLGMWQLDRAEQKREIYKKFMLHQSSETMNLNPEQPIRTDKPAMLWRNVEATGVFSDEIHILLDNQVVKGEAGYFIFTPFRLSNKEVWVLVNRGWLPAGNDRKISPSIETIATEVEIAGVITDVPSSGLLLGDPVIESMTDHIFRVQRIDLKEITGLIKRDLLPYVFRLKTESAQGFLREWTLPGSGEEMHLGYAFQWFALAATLVIVYIFVTLKKIS